jgi:rhodanese-related sulfurtransferase
MQMKSAKLLLSFLLFAASSSLVHAQQTAAASTAAPAAQVWKYKTPKLARAQIDPLLAKPERLLIIDVRRPDELTQIGGFPVYLSIQANDLERSLAFIPKDRQIVTVSNHAGRAGAAADLLASKGFKVVGAIGVENYEEEGGVVTRIAPVAPRASAADAPVVASH